MTCYSVSENLIALLTTYAIKHNLLCTGRFASLDLQEIKTVVHCLASTNIDAVVNRSHDDYDTVSDKIYISNTIDIAASFEPDLYSLGFIAKQLDCYEYQCSGRDWFNSGAFWIVAAIRDHLAQQLDGYNAAPWGMD